MASLSNVIDHYARIIDEVVRRRQVRISVGNLLSYDQYKYECGILQGLQESVELIEEAVRRAEGLEPKEV